MKRVQLFEFEDQKWFPNSLRNYGTDFLRFISHKTKMYGPIIPVLEKGLGKVIQRRSLTLVLVVGVVYYGSMNN